MMQAILDPKWHLFVKVGELGSVSRTAVALDVPQSMVSRHIAQLESDCGAPLFRRTGRGVVLTEFGQQVYPRIKALIAQADQLADDIRTTGGLPMGEVRVGLLPSTVPLLAGPLYAQVHEKFPQVQLRLTEGSSAQLEEWLGEGRLDISLLLREMEQPNVDEPVLIRLPLQLVVRSDDALARRKVIGFEELQGLPLVLPSEPHPLRSRLDQLADERKLTLTVTVEADSIRLQHEIVASGGGYAITAGPLGQGDKSRLVGIRVVRPPLSRAIVLGTTSHRPHTLATRAVSQTLLAVAPVLLKN